MNIKQLVKVLSKAERIRVEARPGSYFITDGYIAALVPEKDIKGDLIKLGAITLEGTIDSAVTLYDSITKVDTEAARATAFYYEGKHRFYTSENLTASFNQDYLKIFDKYTPHLKKADKYVNTYLLFKDSDDVAVGIVLPIRYQGDAYKADIQAICKGVI